MAKRMLKWRQMDGTTTQTTEPASHCPHCGMVKSEEGASLLIDQLFQSHAELCATLRFAGRQVLSSGNRDVGSLERIRKVLKRAEQIRQTLGEPDELPATLLKPNKDHAIEDAPATGYGYTPEQV